jgi:hypothetical protein
MKNAYSVFFYKCWVRLQLELVVVTIWENEPFWHFGQFRISARARKPHQKWAMNSYQ